MHCVFRFNRIRTLTVPNTFAIETHTKSFVRTHNAQPQYTHFYCSRKAIFFICAVHSPFPCHAAVLFIFVNQITYLNYNRDVYFFDFGERLIHTFMYLYVRCNYERVSSIYTIIYIITLHIFVCHSFDLYQYIVTKCFFSQKNRLNAKQH